METNGVFFQFEIIMNGLVSSFGVIEHLCYGSTAISNILILTVRGFRRQNLTSKAANCCRNSQLVVNEDDLQWVTNEKKVVLF